MRTRTARLALVIAAALLGAAAPSDAAPSTTYLPPFAVGPSGGDLGYASAEPGGRVTVARGYPLLGPVSCPGGGSFATLLVQHKGRTPVRRVTASYTEALVDPFVYVSVGVRDATGRWVGSQKAGGASGSGDIVVPVRWDAQVRPPLQVQFGLELSTACPHMDAGTIRFTSVTVSG